MDLREKTDTANRHPWELSRSYHMSKVIPSDSNSTVYADIGSGDRFFTSKLLSVTDGNVYAIDKGYSAKIIEHDRLISLNSVSLLESDSVDILIMMDVLEHVENENEFIEEVLDKLKADGKLFITVPAMQFLFSSHDVFLKHYRRYSRKQLVNLLEIHDLIIEQCYYFYSLLFVARSISLLLEIFGVFRKKEPIGIGSWGYGEKTVITRTLCRMLNMDICINKLLNNVGIHLPGLSIIAICRKKPSRRVWRKGSNCG